MGKGIDKDLFNKFHALSQGPDAALLRKFLDMLYYRHEEMDTEPLSPQEPAALAAGREAWR
jgi:hypothetical protein